MGRQKLSFSGISNEHSILIGSHGNAWLKAEGEFDLSGIVYCPKYAVTLEIKGDGLIRLRGICHRIIIRKIGGSARVDLSQLVCKELVCLSQRDTSTLITGKVRTISNATITDNAVLIVTERPLILNTRLTANARIECGTSSIPTN